MLSLVVARARNGAIGKAGEIPWHAPEDLQMFQRETTGGALIMGRNTWESLPKRPLPNRYNAVISRDCEAENVFTALPDAIAAAYAAGYQRIYGIGGERIYRDLLPLADRLLVTEVDLVVEGADAFFPDFNEDDWRECSRRVLRANGPECILRELLRR